MEKPEFIGMVETICHYWERRVPAKEEELLVWFEAVKWIPAGFGERICDKFFRMESRPVNIPLRIQEVYKSFQSDPGGSADLVISMVMRNARDHDISNVESFYDLREPIRRRRLNIGPVMRWLKSEGVWVDMGRFHEPTCIDFGALRNWLDNPGRLREGKGPVAIGEVFQEEEIPF